jgi:beta-barrel assembly-enhancing protease
MRRLLASLLLPAVLATGCEDADGSAFNVFTVQDDIDLGGQLAAEIAADPKNYPVVDENAFPDAYDHLYAIRDSILSSGEVEYADEFPWEVQFIDDPKTLNAFCAPGGYIYVYSGIVNFLDHEDELVGVMGHEMAHADKRHSTQQLTKLYGIETLLSLLFGDDMGGLAGEIAEGLVALQFSRDNEAQADEYSVRYLCETDYAADGAAGFFEKLIEEEKEGFTPEFLSTHPSSDSRVEDINALASELDCAMTLWDKDGADLDALKAALAL